jgi:hypothetical protein
MMLNDSREPFGRLVNDVWNTWPGAIKSLAWEDLTEDVKELFMRIGKALYDAGFQAGADSVTHV